MWKSNLLFRTRKLFHAKKVQKRDLLETLQETWFFVVDLFHIKPALRDYMDEEILCVK